MEPDIRRPETFDAPLVCDDHAAMVLVCMGERAKSVGIRIVGKRDCETCKVELQARMSCAQADGYPDVCVTCGTGLQLNEICGCGTA